MKEIKFLVLGLLFIFALSVSGKEKKNDSNYPTFEKDVELVYAYWRHKKYRKQFRALQIAKIKIQLQYFISKNPEVILQLYKKNSDLAKQFIKRPFLFFGLTFTNKLDKVMCELVRKFADKITNPTEKKKFLIECLTDRQTCGGSKYTLELWNEMRKIPILTGTMPNTGALVFLKLEKLVKMLNDFETKGKKIGKDDNYLYLGCFKASKIGLEIDPNSFIFNNSPSTLITQEYNFYKSFEEAVRFNKKQIKLDLPKLLMFIAEEGGQRDTPGSRDFLEAVSKDGDPSFQVFLEGKKNKIIKYIFSFPNNKESVLDDGFYVVKVIFSEKSVMPKELISLKVIPLSEGFKTFMREKIIPVVYKYQSEFENEYKKLQKQKAKELEWEAKQAIPDDDDD